MVPAASPAQPQPIVTVAAAPAAAAMMDESAVHPIAATSSSGTSKGLPRLTLNLDLAHMAHHQTEDDHKHRFEYELSKVYDFLYISGSKVAANRDQLLTAGITNIVNCNHLSTPDYFPADFEYLSMNLLDSKEENLHCFICRVVRYIDECGASKKRVLLHCEKGISRSCSFAIAYHMWRHKGTYQEAYEHLCACRSQCNPNIGFMCQLSEFHTAMNLVRSDTAFSLLLRLAMHSPVYDVRTPVLKVYLNPLTRQVLQPSGALLRPQGVFVLITLNRVFVWRGALASEEAAALAASMCACLLGVLTKAQGCEAEAQGAESSAFSALLAPTPDPPAAPLVDDSDLFLLVPDTVEPALTQNAEAGTGGETVGEEGVRVLALEGDALSPLGIYDEDDLAEDAVLLVLGGGQAFVWLGGAAAEDEAVRRVHTAASQLQGFPCSAADVQVNR